MSVERLGKNIEASRDKFASFTEHLYEAEGLLQEAHDTLSHATQGTTRRDIESALEKYGDEIRHMGELATRFKRVTNDLGSYLSRITLEETGEEYVDTKILSGKKKEYAATQLEITGDSLEGTDTIIMKTDKGVIRGILDQRYSDDGRKELAIDNFEVNEDARGTRHAHALGTGIVREAVLRGATHISAHTENKDVVNALIRSVGIDAIELVHDWWIADILYNDDLSKQEKIDRAIREGGINVSVSLNNPKVRKKFFK